MSSSSLTGLVNQLHTMENSFTHILMEAIMRLSSLTDASVFLLLETPEGRRYCGKRHLCDTYRTQGLCPSEDELEMELVPGVSTLQVRRHPTTLQQSDAHFSPSIPTISPGTLSQSFDPNQQHQQQQHHQFTPNYRKRSGADETNFDVTSPRKLMRHSPSVPNQSNNHQPHHPLYQPYAQCMTSGQAPADGDMISGDDPASSSGEGDTGDVVFVDVKKEEGGVRSSGGDSYLDDRTGDRCHKMDGLQMTTANSNQMANALGFKGDGFLDSFARKAAVDQLSLEEKLDIMKGLSPESLLKPGAADTEEYLIFQKVCYEFCRACALECPMDVSDVDAYFDTNFNAFANVFPKLNTNVDVLYHMRLLTKRSYKQYLKTRGKRKNDHSKMATFFS